MAITESLNNLCRRTRISICLEESSARDARGDKVMGGAWPSDSGSELNHAVQYEETHRTTNLLAGIWRYARLADARSDASCKHSLCADGCWTSEATLRRRVLPAWHGARLLVPGSRGPAPREAAAHRRGASKGQG